MNKQIINWITFTLEVSIILATGKLIVWVAELTRKNCCIVVDNNPTYLGMLVKLRDYVTWGEIDQETFKLLLKERGRLSGNKALEVLGPSVTPTKKGGKEYSLLFKAVSKKNLHFSVKSFLELLGSYKCLNVKI